MATSTSTTSDRIGTGFLDPALCVTVLPAAAGFPEFSIASLKPSPNGSLLDALARAWRRESMRADMLMIDTDEDEAIDAIADARDARTALIAETMTQLRAETGHDVAALLEVALGILDNEDGNLYGEIAQRFQRLVFAAKVASYRLQPQEVERHAAG